MVTSLVLLINRKFSGLRCRQAVGASSISLIVTRTKDAPNIGKVQGAMFLKLQVAAFI